LELIDSKVIRSEAMAVNVSFFSLGRAVECELGV